MKHYRQIIINIEVEDDLPEQKLDELVDKVKVDLCQYLGHKNSNLLKLHSKP